MILQRRSFSGPYIGVFLGGKYLLSGLIYDEKLTKCFKKEINNLDTQEKVMNEVLLAIEAVFDSQVVGIGIGVPSQVDTSRGIVYNTVNIPSWKEVHLKDLLEQRFKVPVMVNNDANCFTIGEKYFGKAIDYCNVVGLILGTGMGCGIWVDHKLYAGANCGAGEFGSIPYRDYDYEYYCTIGYFVEKYGVKYNVLIHRAKEKDKIALAIMEQFGIDIGNAIKTIMYAVDPEVVVIGGVLAEAFPFFEKSMRKTIRSFRYKVSVEKLQVLADDSPYMAVLGAAALFYNHSYL